MSRGPEKGEPSAHGQSHRVALGPPALTIWLDAVYSLASFRWHWPSCGCTRPPSFPSSAMWGTSSVVKTSKCSASFRQPIFSWGMEVWWVQSLSEHCPSQPQSIRQGTGWPPEVMGWIRGAYWDLIKPLERDPTELGKDAAWTGEPYMPRDKFPRHGSLRPRHLELALQPITLFPSPFSYTWGLLPLLASPVISSLEQLLSHPHLSWHTRAGWLACLRWWVSEHSSPAIRLNCSECCAQMDQ